MKRTKTRTLLVTLAGMLLSGALASTVLAQTSAQARWWSNPRVAEGLGLSDEQRESIEAIVYENESLNIDLNAAEKKAKAGDKDALAVFEELAQNIGEFLVTVLYVLSPEAIVIGGSVANSWDLLEKGIRKRMEEIYLVPMISSKVELVKAELDNAGLFGAAALCISQMD